MQGRYLSCFLDVGSMSTFGTWPGNLLYKCMAPGWMECDGRNIASFGRWPCQYRNCHDGHCHHCCWGCDAGLVSWRLMTVPVPFDTVLFQHGIEKTLMSSIAFVYQKMVSATFCWNRQCRPVCWIKQTSPPVLAGWKRPNLSSSNPSLHCICIAIRQFEVQPENLAHPFQQCRQSLEPRDEIMQNNWGKCGIEYAMLHRLMFFQ